MESNAQPPTSAQAAAAIAEAEEGRASLAGGIVVPRWFFLPIGAAVALQIGTTATGLGATGDGMVWLFPAGLLALLFVMAVELARFRSRNGVWLGRLVSKVVGGTATAASTSYGAGLAGAIWAALAGAWWLVPVCSVAGGAGYALSGRAWVRSYRAEPAAHGRGEPAAVLAVLAVLALAGLVLLLSLR